MESLLAILGHRRRIHGRGVQADLVSSGLRYSYGLGWANPYVLYSSGLASGILRVASCAAIYEYCVFWVVLDRFVRHHIQ